MVDLKEMRSPNLELLLALFYTDRHITSATSKRIPLLSPKEGKSHTTYIIDMIFEHRIVRGRGVRARVREVRSQTHIRVYTCISYS